MIIAKELKKFRSSLRTRKRATRAEVEFRELLRREKVPHKFQMILGFYILDFVIPDKMFVIEIDGSVHDNKEQKDYDSRRDAFIKRCGFSILRVKNENVKNFDISIIKNMKIKEEYFRSALGKANSIKGVIISRRKAQLNIKNS